MSDTAPVPVEIRLHQASRSLEIAYADGDRYQLPCEYLRVYSPSAEVRGHGLRVAIVTAVPPSTASLAMLRVL